MPDPEVRAAGVQIPDGDLWLSSGGDSGWRWSDSYVRAFTDEDACREALKQAPPPF